MNLEKKILFRIEKDSVGVKEVPEDAYYGVQSLRAYENFRITGLQVHSKMIDSLASIKKAAALTNRECGLLEERIADAIVTACDSILAGNLHEQFIVDPVQGGAGTSLNMNANEVIANCAIELLGGKKGDYAWVNPNDHVNLGQSTNDVIPTAGKITAIELLCELEDALMRLVDALQAKADEFDDIIKMGRTQLQDAVPIRLGQEFAAYASAIRRNQKRIDNVKRELFSVNLGGTAIGTCINADPCFVARVVPHLSNVTGLEFKQAENLIDSTQNLDVFVAVSGVLVSCAVTLSKMSNDLRLLSSGPYCGFGEINLPPRQNGSSIMPGKINPVIPEVVSQVAFRVIGNNTTITMAAEAGQLELNAFEPIVFHSLFESIGILSPVIDTLVDNCIVGITANREHCVEILNKSVGVVTALCPYIGYQKSSAIAKEAAASGVSVRELVLQQGLFTAEELGKVLDPYEMTVLKSTLTQTRAEDCASRSGAVSQ